MMHMQRYENERWEQTGSLSFYGMFGEGKDRMSL